ncbi:hypothetical protein DPV78_008600 [Talaromyces pinophilus]|nr:hypothetical protein DPV78_008600 [Talaromyces pinophilus]
MHTRFPAGCCTPDLGSWRRCWIFSRTDPLGASSYLIGMARSLHSRHNPHHYSHRNRISSPHKFGASLTTCGMLDAIGGGIAQADLTMGMTTCMKTVEVRCTKAVGVGGARVHGTMETFFQIIREKGFVSLQLRCGKLPAGRRQLEYPGLRKNRFVMLPGNPRRRSWDWRKDPRFDEWWSVELLNQPFEVNWIS